MKKIIILLIAALGSISTAKAGDKIQTAKIKTQIGCDHCKLCESCGARIEKALYEIKGVKRVDVDDKAMEIVVAYNTEKTSLGKIKETITNNGYDADDMKATPESFAKLDDCCKGGE